MNTESTSAEVYRPRNDSFFFTGVEEKARNSVWKGEWIINHGK